MPPISLVVCVYRERELLERLLAVATGCFDDLVVVHDGPDSTGVRSLVEAAGGRFFERPRAYQQEPHWPFAWEQAAHDWILRLDADEFPSEELKSWLQEFRRGNDPLESVPGYTCIWPLWDGNRETTRQWPDGRNFLFHRQRVRFFGMVEAVPIPDGRWMAVPLVLRHQPRRKSYGVVNLVFRKQAYHWRRVIALSLLEPVNRLPCWRWTSPEWPGIWQEVRRNPMRTAVRRLVMGPIRQGREMWRKEHTVLPSALLGTGLHQCLIAVTFFFFHRRFGKKLPKP